MPNLPNGTKGGFEPGLTRLRVRHSTTELPRSTMYAERSCNIRSNPMAESGKKPLKRSIIESLQLYEGRVSQRGAEKHDSGGLVT